MRHQFIQNLVTLAAWMMFCAGSSLAGEPVATQEDVVLGTKYTIHSEILGDDHNRDFTPPYALVQRSLRYPTSGGSAMYSPARSGSRRC